MTYTYKVYLKGNPDPVVVHAETPLLDAEAARLDMLTKDEGHSFAFINPDGTFVRFRASEVQAVVLVLADGVGR